MFHQGLFCGHRSERGEHGLWLPLGTLRHKEYIQWIARVLVWLFLWR